MLLQVLDDGRLTDGQGRTVDFRNTMIIMTSNLGAEYLTALGENEDSDTVRDQVMDVVKMAFRPEFLNRVDDIVVFKALAKEQVKKIAAILLQGLNERLQRQVKISLTWSDEVLEALAAQGFDPNFGARPLRRLLSHTVETALSKEIIKGEIKEGDVVTIGLANGEFTFSAK